MKNKKVRKVLAYLIYIGVYLGYVYLCSLGSGKPTLLMMGAVTAFGLMLFAIVMALLWASRQFNEE